MYNDTATCFTQDDFYTMKELVECPLNGNVPLHAIEHLNDGNKHLAFIVSGEELFA